jgi:hypothetical protein
MADFAREDLTGSTFHRVVLTDSRFERVDLNNARFRAVDFSRSEFRGVEMSDVLMRGVWLSRVDIHGEVEHVTINGVEVGPLIDAELNRRYPERAKLRPTDPAGFAEGWEIIERLWDGTVERARGLDPALLHESVNGEWSFIETLRHLAFATECWVLRAILGDPAPWAPLSLPWDEMPDTPGVPRDREVRPSLDEVLELRHDRMASVRAVIAELTEESLDRKTEPVDAPGWPPPVSFPVRECLLNVLNEEWEHRLYAERDLDVLAG